MSIRIHEFGWAPQKCDLKACEGRSLNLDSGDPATMPVQRRLSCGPVSTSVNAQLGSQSVTPAKQEKQKMLTTLLRMPKKGQFAKKIDMY